MTTERVEIPETVPGASERWPGDTPAQAVQDGAAYVHDVIDAGIVAANEVELMGARIAELRAAADRAKKAIDMATGAGDNP
ncbi:MAG: hypothetical protein AAGA68_26670 [Pseudomonadota bacterium]